MNDWLEFLRSRGAVFEADAAPPCVAGFGQPELEQAAARDGAVMIPLSTWTTLAISGADATAFLHGQFTNDVAGLAVGAVEYNGYCSAKGRLLATFVLARTGDSDYLLIVPGDIAPAFEKRLRMFMLRARLTIVAQQESHVCIGIAGPAGAGAAKLTAGALQRHENFLFVGLPDAEPLGRWVAVCEGAQAPAYWDDLARSATPAGVPVWTWLGINAGVASVTAPVQDRFVPQMLNWEVIGGVSFQKGCYPGQEIVARMQYLGKLKERLYRASVTGREPVPVGMAIYGEQFGDQACGSIINAAPAPDGNWDVLAVLQIASADHDRLRLGAPDAARELTLLPLPYAVPAAREK